MKKKPAHRVLLIKPGFYLVLLGILGFMGFSKRKKDQKVLYEDLKLIFMW